ncbi:C25 family cysteine peptidase [Dyadobacter bucti]|uniref:putative type IX secretion system sortase PorU2 n=1 Tax=Dyadobacter bucti TaxID=2572203 RepID=UPI003F71ECBD
MTRFFTHTFYLFIFLLLLVRPVKGQRVYGNEWVNTSQTYLRIPVVETGFYRVTSLELIAAGFPADSVSSSSLQMFRRGKELAIEVSEDSSGRLGSIGFFGERNDGVLDSSLYLTPAAMPHSKYSLYSDTSAYFLTARSDGGKGKRIIGSKTADTRNVLHYHFEESLQLFTSHYLPGAFYPAGSGFENGSVLTDYDTGEGWTGPPINDPQHYILETKNVVREKFTETELEILVAGTSAGEHPFEIHIQASGIWRKIVAENTTDYNSRLVKTKLLPSDLDSQGKITIRVLSINAENSISISYIRLRYPQRSILEKESRQKIFHFNNSNDSPAWQLEGANDVGLYDCSDPYQLRKIEENSSGIPISAKIIGIRKPLKIHPPRLVRFRNINPENTDYLIITHPLMRKPVEGYDPVSQYADYRASARGGAFKPLIIHSEEAFDQFNYGESGPGGIKNLIAWMYQGRALQFVLLIGRSIDPQTARKQLNSKQTDMVPNAGWPGSDIALVMGIDSVNNFTPAVPVGRINAFTAENVSDYLQKVIALESEQASAPWRKNVLHLSGGRSADERSLFRNDVKSFEQKIAGSSLNVNIKTISKQTDEPVEQFPVHEPVNNGVALMTLFGHSSPDVTDLDIGYASDTDRKYTNRPHYPAIIVNGCATGSIFYTPKTLSSDWIFAKDKGAVLFLAHTFNGSSTSLRRYTGSFYEVLADSAFSTQPFGLIQQEAIRRNSRRDPSIIDKITAQQMTLHGDPAIRIFPSKLPDYSIDSRSIQISDILKEPLNSHSDSILIQLIVTNNGRYRKENYMLSIQRINDSTVNFKYDYLHEAPRLADTLYIRIPNNVFTSGKERWTFAIDPKNELAEETRLNNYASKEIFVQEGGAMPLLPAHDHITNKNHLELIAQVPYENSVVTFEWDTISTFTNPKNAIAIAKGILAKYTIEIPAVEGQKTFWRVYMPEDRLRPSHFRSVTYLSELSETKRLPECVVSFAGKNAETLQEGDDHHARLVFNNVTEIDFSDSIEISIRELHQDTLGKVTKIPPLRAHEIREFEWKTETIDAVGSHHIIFEFNDSRLPEENFANNVARFRYEVVPDATPPVLIVKTDGRQLENGDIVSPLPTIAIQLFDENKFLIRKDTLGIELWLKENCLNCREQRIYFGNSPWKLVAPNNFLAELKLSRPLKSGEYRLRVNARDVKGNFAPEYQISFRVNDTNGILTAHVSPNPSDSWFKFNIEFTGSTVPGNLSLKIFDASGKTVHNAVFDPHPGKNEWIWHPENLASGMYFYRLKMIGLKAPLKPEVLKPITGRLLWLR